MELTFTREDGSQQIVSALRPDGVKEGWDGVEITVEEAGDEGGDGEEEEDE